MTPCCNFLPLFFNGAISYRIVVQVLVEAGRDASVMLVAMLLLDLIFVRSKWRHKSQGRAVPACLTLLLSGRKLSGATCGSCMKKITEGPVELRHRIELAIEEARSYADGWRGVSWLILRLEINNSLI